ncbi:hypothetical protein F1880_001210 [Penicillium rolfsii]|nr:hypothetical protein F1880_001210 [Penicillium rolfsii]
MGPGNFTCGFGPVDAVRGKSADSRDSPASVTIPASESPGCFPCPTLPAEEGNNTSANTHTRKPAVRID